MSKAKKFSCVHCGTPFEVYPPDDNHPTASLEKPQEADVSGTIIEMTYDCKTKHCLKPTVLYWYSVKRSFDLG
jgi:hypothetical protein